MRSCDEYLAQEPVSWGWVWGSQAGKATSAILFSTIQSTKFSINHISVQSFPDTNINYTLAESILSVMPVVHRYHWPRVLPSLHRLFQACYLKTAINCKGNIKSVTWMNEYGVLIEWHWQGKNWSTQRKTCACAILSTTNPTWTGLGLNQGLCGDRMATNYLSHGSASVCNVWVYNPTKPAPVMLEVICPKYDGCLQCSKVTITNRRLLTQNRNCSTYWFTVQQLYYIFISLTKSK